jgi:hypothetical protein
MDISRGPKRNRWGSPGIPQTLKITNFDQRLSHHEWGYPGAEGACFIEVTTSAVVRAAYSEDLAEVRISVSSRGKVLMKVYVAK